MKTKMSALLTDKRQMGLDALHVTPECNLATWPQTELDSFTATQQRAELHPDPAKLVPAEEEPH